MTYIDTSSLLKLVLTDHYSAATEAALVNEAVIVVSTLTELEACVQLRALSRSGTMKPRQVDRARRDLSEILGSRPFTSRPLKGTVFSDAIEQHDKSTIHCRSLDRLHLAAMAELGVRRLVTHDVRQAEAAREQGYEVVMPGAEI